ncbi:LETM1 domain-containing protein 1 isoform X2 [Centruroides vittatus]|uniref:LETM1 domain-containing protein 1 isoform X2 n=1 Tax=Centruroides vittatus TaxID=120091 RepID=UPI00350EA59D
MLSRICRFRLVFIKDISPQRLYSTGSSSKNGSKYVKPAKGLKQYFENKFSRFVKGYEIILQNKFPSAFKVYQVFSVGTKELYRDIKEYMRISHDLRYGKSVRNLTRKELEIYFQIPKDMKKVVPVLLISTLPFVNYVVFPLAYLFPRYFLSSHFWSLQQRIDFALNHHKRRLYNYRPVFRHLQAKLLTINDKDLKGKWANILHQIGSGVHPPVNQILDVKTLFVNEPYSLRSLSSSHLSGLCRLHGLSAFPFKSSRLWNHAGFIREMDLAMEREGMSMMSLDELRRACFMRGLSPLGLHRDEMITWLNQWTLVSKNIDSRSLSLLLHCPILLAYNYSSNWILIH